MEFPRRSALIERGLAAFLLALILAASWAESRSPLAEAVRAGRPWPFWLTLRPQGASSRELFLAVLRPRERALSLIYFPDRSRPADEESRLSLYTPLPQPPPFPVFDGGAETAGPPSPAPLAAEKWLLEKARRPLFWLGLRLDPIDRLVLALEMRALAEDGVRAAWLPEPGDRPAFFASVFSMDAGRPAPGRTLTAEVLNASPVKGVASQAAKVLRWGGVDVTAWGNWFGPGYGETTIVDRTGRAGDALEIRRRLGCPRALVLTQVDLKKLVDATVIIEGDCSPRPEGVREKAWTWLKSLRNR